MERNLTPDTDPPDPPRRSFLSAASTAAMGGGLLVSYGLCAAYAARYLYPARDQPTGWMYVAPISRLKKGDSMRYRTPAGAAVSITRQGDTGTVDDFIALSSTCPHLGCQVHWEAQNNRFFCPCHNGAFDPSGQPTAGPPADAGQSLPEYELMIDAGLLFIRVKLVSLG